jgi:predicted amidohydrolase
MLNVGIAQMQAEPLRVEDNLSQAESLIAKVAGDGAQLVVLPEMFNVGFYFGEELMRVAETLDGKTVNRLKHQAARYNICIITSLYERFKGHFYNTMVLVGSDGNLQYYRKRNPTCQEMTVWRRSDVPGPGIFDTPFGRIGGVICFDSFARETFEGFKESGVEMVIIIALWGTVRSVSFRPDILSFRPVLRRWSHLASEVVPLQYAVHLSVPTVFVNQGGMIRTPIPFPRFWLLPSVPNVEYDFWGRSHVRSATGEVLVRAENIEKEFWAVVPVDLRQTNERRPIKRSDITPRYLSSAYYFVQPPFMAKLLQEWSFRGFKREYEARRTRHSSP